MTRAVVVLSNCPRKRDRRVVIVAGKRNHPPYALVFEGGGGR
jgi:hypothetical protein